MIKRLLFILFLTPFTLMSQSWYGGDITPQSNCNLAGLGNSVAISGDGSTYAAGSPAYHNPNPNQICHYSGSGLAYVRKTSLPNQFNSNSFYTDTTLYGPLVCNGGFGNISDLTGIEDFTALTYLNCYYNQLTSLDVSNNTALIHLDCYNNQLTSLNLSGCTALDYLLCGNNQLESLDVSQNTTLINLYCEENQLSNLDVSQNTALLSFYCNYNPPLTCLNLKNGNNLNLHSLVCSIHSLDKELLELGYV